VSDSGLSPGTPAKLTFIQEQIDEWVKRGVLRRETAMSAYSEEPGIRALDDRRQRGVCSSDLATAQRTTLNQAVERGNRTRLRANLVGSEGSDWHIENRHENHRRMKSWKQASFAVISRPPRWSGWSS
jgi:hypothetical protein